ncbi:D-aminoacylase [Alkalihalobacillus sp. MEB130]|uniref:N-acyl-D-amino-acid deacylase family protein n=1 Tax=Alkalihalobacillus sp. MEB130 TaxID=2976704 RepID=UPI0028DD4D5E|nr:D-aminoacylase [Alkalihalobacillus sp. MEB130]MDT8859684.1 D-aminoacylase [Alkalihalobacillus sp. MEB130]
MNVDTLIKNGLVIDGTGQKGKHQLVAIKENKIILPQTESHVIAKEVIDADGLVVAPGFIDIHTHSDITLLVDSRGASKVSQGITTEIIGNCGMGAAPCPSERKSQIKETGSVIYAEEIEWSWNEYKEYLKQFQIKGVSMNVGFLLGHGAIRAAVMGFEDRTPTKAEMNEMKEYIREGLKLGAVGMSSGLEYPPGMFADVEELAELCKVVVEYGGIYSTHMRNEDEYLLDSIEESIEVARKSGVSLQVSHLKAVGKQNWGKVVLAIERLESAEKEGLNVHYDFYPYTASSTSLTSQLPKWAQAGGWSKLADRLSDVELRKKIIEEVKQKIESSVGWESIVIASVQTKENAKLEGRNLEEIAKVKRQSPVEAMLNLIYEETGSVKMIKFSMSEEDVSTVAAGKLSMVGSDGYALAKEGPLSIGKPHPRSYGSFPRVFAEYQRKQNLFSLEQAIYKMTGAVAKKLNFIDRGTIHEGCYADLVIFHPELIKDVATYTNPHQYSEGIHTVYVNGHKVYETGKFLDPKTGVMIKPGTNL